MGPVADIESHMRPLSAEITDADADADGDAADGARAGAGKSHGSRAEDSDSMDEEDYYREAVGEAPDPELFTKGTSSKARGFVPKRWLKRKRGDESGAASEGDGPKRKRRD
eukprot:Amastigsp_a703037_4.p2 type:complete len:111 gc:universal Amastigsp_a703037_4:1-333(+)